MTWHLMRKTKTEEEKAAGEGTASGIFPTSGYFLSWFLVISCGDSPRVTNQLGLLCFEFLFSQGY